MVVFFVVLLESLCCISKHHANLSDDLQNLKYELSINGKKYVFFDIKHSVKVRNDYLEEYNVSKIDFKHGDVVIDIGGNIGLFAIPLSIKFPFLKIYSFEPDKRNFDNFKRNLEVNNISEEVIKVENKAVTRDGRNITMIACPGNSGCSKMSDILSNSSRLRRNITSSDHLKSITMMEIFRTYGIDICKMLKMDCEGCEYEVLYNMENNLLDKIENFRGEFHPIKAYDRTAIKMMIRKEYHHGLSDRKLFRDMANKLKNFEVTITSRQSKRSIRKKEIKKLYTKT